MKYFCYFYVIYMVCFGSISGLAFNHYLEKKQITREAAFLMSLPIDALCEIKVQNI